MENISSVSPVVQKLVGVCKFAHPNPRSRMCSDPPPGIGLSGNVKRQIDVMSEWVGLKMTFMALSSRYTFITALKVILVGD